MSEIKKQFSRSNLIGSGIILALVGAAGYFFLVPKFEAKNARVQEAPVVSTAAKANELSRQGDYCILEGTISSNNTPLLLQHGANFKYVLAVQQTYKLKRHSTTGTTSRSRDRDRDKRSWQTTAVYMNSFNLDLKESGTIQIQPSSAMRKTSPSGDYRESSPDSSTISRRRRFQGYSFGDRLSLLGKFSSAGRLVADDYYGGPAQGLKKKTSSALFWIRLVSIIIGVLGPIVLIIGLFKKKEGQEEAEA